MNSHEHYLAAYGSASLLILIVGVIVAAVLLAAFWLGPRRTAGKRVPPPQKGQPRSDSWQTPEESQRQSAPPGERE